MLRRTVVNTSIPGWDGRKYENTAGKVSRLGSDLLLDYADTTVTGLGQLLDDYRKSGDGAALEQLEEGLLNLWAISRELRQRGMV